MTGHIPKVRFLGKKINSLSTFEFQSSEVFYSTVPIWLALVSCTQNISLDYLFFQVRKNETKKQETHADSRKVASPGAE